MVMSMRGFDDLADIARQNYDTGAYGGAHLRITRATFDMLKALASAPPDHCGRIGELTGIPIVLDDGLPPHVWRLVDNKTNAVLREGVWPVT